VGGFSDLKTGALPTSHAVGSCQDQPNRPRGGFVGLQCDLNSGENRWIFLGPFPPATLGEATGVIEMNPSSKKWGFGAPPPAPPPPASATPRSPRRSRRCRSPRWCPARSLALLSPDGSLAEWVSGSYNCLPMEWSLSIFSGQSLCSRLTRHWKKIVKDCQHYRWRMGHSCKENTGKSKLCFK